MKDLIYRLAAFFIPKSLYRALFPTKERFWEVFRFLLVGGFCFLLEYALLYSLTEFAHLPYLYSSAIAFCISLVLNYILCVTFVFHAYHQTTMQAVLFVITSLMGLGINQATMWFFVEIAGLWYMAAKLIASAIVMIWNYFTKRFILNKS
jgi:putative flippase GtrA